MSEKKNPLVKFENIGKRFGRVEALKDIIKNFKFTF